MKIWKNSFASFATLMVLAVCSVTGRINAQGTLPCDPIAATFPTYKPFVQHLFNGKSIVARAYTVPPDLNETFVFDALSLGEVLRRAEGVTNVKFFKNSVTGANCLKAIGFFKGIGSSTTSTVELSWTVQDNRPKIKVPFHGTIATHTAGSGNVFFYKGAPGHRGILLTLEKT